MESLYAVGGIILFEMLIAHLAGLILYGFYVGLGFVGGFILNWAFSKVE